MPAKEIKELRQAGKLEEAYAMAKAELEADLSNIWGKRNLSWVLYAQLDGLASNLDGFVTKINEVKELNLPESEEMFFENISIVISKAARAITHEAAMDISKIHYLFDSIKELTLKRNSKWYSILYSAMHKGMKHSNRYIEFADWWDFKNFRPEDFQKEKMPNGKEIMAIAEQAYIAYSKHLLPKQTEQGEIIFNQEKVEVFLPMLSQIIENHPQFQYPMYFKAKLLLAKGNTNDMLTSLIPFAKKKQNDFWVWEILAEAFPNDPEKIFACYCKGLSCSGPEEMLVGLRQKMAKILISRNRFNEARTEIQTIIKVRHNRGFNIPDEVISWIITDWYKNALPSDSNSSFYKDYTPIAEALLFSDVPEESVIVEFVNTDKKVLNFIASETKFGFFKYSRFLTDVKVGDTLKVRFKAGSNGDVHYIYTAVKLNDDSLKSKFIKEVHNIVRITAGKSYGFIDDAFIHPLTVSRHKLKDGMTFSGTAIKSYNKEKRQWGWKLL